MRESARREKDRQEENANAGGAPEWCRGAAVDILNVEIPARTKPATSELGDEVQELHHSCAPASAQRFRGSPRLTAATRAGEDSIVI